MNINRLMLPVWAGWLATGAGVLAVCATYWDESWHTDIGRDSAWIAPHLLLYGSVAVVGLVIGWWGLQVLRGTRSIRATVGCAPFMLAAAGALTVLAAAPIDAFWHAQFGRDAVQWSPPHMLVLFASVALVTGILCGLPPNVPLRWAASVLLLSNAVAVVFEYETGVPQFSEVWYLPILISAGLLVASIVKTSVPVGFPVAATVLGYAFLRLVIGGALMALGRSTPDLPIAVVGLAAADLPLRSARKRYTAAAAAAAGLAWASAQMQLANQQPSAVAVTAAPVVAVGMIALIAGRRRWAAVPVVVAAAAVAAIAAPTTAAWAHDPGQGPAAGEAHLTMSTDAAHTISVSVSLNDCHDVTPVQVTARRAGRTHTGPLTAVDVCSYRGTVTVPTGGRWFTYVEFNQHGRIVEAWLPIDANHPATIDVRRVLYLPAGTRAATTAQTIVGAAIYAVGLALLVAAARVTVSSRRRPPRLDAKPH